MDIRIYIIKVTFQCYNRERWHLYSIHSHYKGELTNLMNLTSFLIVIGIMTLTLSTILLQQKVYLLPQ